MTDALTKAAQAALIVLEGAAMSTTSVEGIAEAASDLRAALAARPEPQKLRRGTTGTCSRSACICERDELGNECIWLRPAEPMIDGYPLMSGLPPPATQPQQAAAEVERLRTELAKAERCAIRFADIIDRHCIAMQAAVIDESHKSATAAMQWISNTLIGPGLYPDMSEALGMSETDPAQAWFDAKVAESEAFRAAHPAPEVPPAQHQQSTGEKP